MSRLAALAFALALPMLAMPLAASATEAEKRLIVVAGEGSVGARPDMALLNAGVGTQAPTAREALDANSAAIAAVIAAIKAEGIEAKDIETTTVTLQPMISYPDQKNGVPQPPVVIGYQVSNAVTVRVRDLSKVGVLLDRAVGAGANAIGGVSFVVSRQGELLDEARKAAVADARRKAELYAAAAGVTLGPLASLSEQGPGQPFPQPMMRMAAADSAGGGAVPVEAGEQRLSVTISAVWSIAD